MFRQTHIIFCHAGFFSAYVAIALLTSASAQAKEYSIDYNVSGGASYNDNEGLSREDERATSGARIAFPISFKMRGDQVTASFLSELKSYKFDDSGYDSNGQNFESNATYQRELGSVSGKAGYMRGSTLATEFLDTGRIGGVATRVERATAGGSGTYLLTEKSRAFVTLNYGQTDYASPRYIGGTIINSGFGAAHQWTERTSLSLGGNVSRYQNNADRQTTSDIIGSRAGFESVLSENLDVALTGGISYVTTSFDTNSATSRPDSDTTAYVVNGAVNYRQERYSLSATLARNIRPTGNGDLNIFDQVNMTYRYQLSDLSGFNASLLGGNTEALEGAIDNDRRFAQIGLGISYKLAASWSVSGDYTYRYQDNGSGSAQSNAVEIRLTFNPKEYIWSR
jgi:hypothetical protein